ncbi:hypothetical protein KTE50_17930 [Burkholderia multivorans]|uniref:hypothetical protein n=1 Tax=Burkholderia multivorans TaxID=87883 RepID=UPI001C26C955|nr:hypothetical protein [Burkholderia multivorans]MBU9550421.1 hypothetical protein [Burkholderia multivorans]
MRQQLSMLSNPSFGEAGMKIIYAMMRLVVLFSAVIAPSFGQVPGFVPGQVLTAAQLNNAFQTMVPLTGAVMTGPLTVPSITATSTVSAGSGTFGTLTTTSPLGFSSGGTGATSAVGATSNLQYLQGATGSVARSLTSKLQETISLLDFGADPTGALDSTTAWTNFVAAVKMTGKRGEIPAGTYKITSPQTIDLASISPKGIYICGAGQYSAMLDMSSVTTSPAFQIIDTGNAGGGAFYSTFCNFGIKTNLAGTSLQLGKTDFSDALNEFEFRNIWVGNNSTSALANAIQVNYVLNTHFFAVIAANNGHGDAWQINAGAFNVWAGGSGTYADNGYHLTAGGAGNGTISGNIFMGIDHEVNAVANVKIDTANAWGNTWIGGTFVYNPGTSYAFAASAGHDNTIISPATQAYPSGMPTLSNFFNGNVGIGTVNVFAQTTLPGQVTTPVANISAAAGASRPVYFQTNGSNRWAAYGTSQAETGANAGTNFSISRYSDSGAFIDSPIGIVRSSGLVNINDGLAVNGSITASTTGAMALYTNSGSAVNAPHMVNGSATLSSGSATVTLNALAVFSSATSYVCAANDSTAANPVKVSNVSGSQFALTGSANDTIYYVCSGN